MKWVSTAVHPEGEGYSAFVYEEDGTRHRLSPSWQREVKEDRLATLPVPLKEKGKTGTIKRLVPVVVGHKTVVGESLTIATQRADKALRLIASGKAASIVIPKESA